MLPIRRFYKETGKMIATSKIRETAQGKGFFKRSGVDRRAGEDRRKVHSFEYFAKGGVERRVTSERRRLPEQRDGWIRITEWSSVYVGAA